MEFSNNLLCRSPILLYYTPRPLYMLSYLNNLSALKPSVVCGLLPFLSASQLLASLLVL